MTEIPRLSPKEMLVLQLLATNGRMYGLEMVLESRGRLKRGTIYVTLSRMKKKGYVTSQRAEAPPGHRGPARHVYQATGLGADVLRAWETALRAFATEGAR